MKAAPRADRAEIEEVAKALNVSRETFSAWTAYIAVLEAWAPVHNLIGPAEWREFGQRHLLDCAQLPFLAPAARRWVDLGSGAGLPGLVIAAMLIGIEGAEVTLVERDQKKAVFLRAAIRAMGVPATVLALDATQLPEIDCDVVTARALAPMADLLRLSQPLIRKGAIGLFPKGKEVERELTALPGFAHYHFIRHSSRSDSAGVVVEARSVLR